MKINYSIIIPHKNIPHLLQRCLDSIPQQDDLEIIIIDDDSDPQIVDFFSFPGHGRNGVSIIFDKTDKGPGSARNIGIKKARGQWIIFIDADDYFNYCIKDILTDYRNDKTDVVFFPASSVDSDTYINTTRSDAFVGLINGYFTNTNIGEFKLRFVLASPWGKLIKRSLLIENDIEFPNVLICEDVKFSYLLGYYAKSIKVDQRALCCYTSRAITRSTISSDEVFLDKIRVYAERDKFLMSHRIPLPLGDFYIDALLNLKEENKKELFDKVINILNDFGISKKEIDSIMNSKKKKRRGIILRDTYIWKVVHIIKRKIIQIST